MSNKSKNALKRMLINYNNLKSGFAADPNVHFHLERKTAISFAIFRKHWGQESIPDLISSSQNNPLGFDFFDSLDYGSNLQVVDHLKFDRNY